MEVKDLTKLYDDYLDITDNAEACMQHMMTNLVDGHIVPQEEVDSLVRNLNQLNQCYMRMYRIIQDFGALNPNNIDRISAHELIKIYNELEMQKKLEQRQNSLQTLSDFLFLTADEIKYKDILIELQLNARLLHDQLNNFSSEAISQNQLFLVKSYQVALSAILKTSGQFGIGFDDADDLDSNFPAVFWMGVALQKYRFDTEVSFQLIQDKSDSVLPEEDLTNIDVLRTDDVQTEQTNTNQAIEGCDLLEHDNRDTYDVVIEQEVSSPKNSIMDDITHSEHTLSSRNLIKTIQANAKAFKNDIQRLHPDVYFILPLFTHLGLMTPAHVFYYGKCLGHFQQESDQERITSILESLVSRHYVVAYEWGDEDTPPEDATFYCLSKVGYACLKKDSIENGLRQKWKINYGNHIILAEEHLPFSESLDVLMSNSMIASYILSMLSQLPDDLFTHVMRSIEWSVDTYEVAVFWQHNFHQCHLVAEDAIMHINDGINVLVLVLNNLSEVEPKPGVGMVFALNDNILYKWEGVWVQETVDADNQEKLFENPDHIIVNNDTEVGQKTPNIDAMHDEVNVVEASRIIDVPSMSNDGFSSYEAADLSGNVWSKDVDQLKILRSDEVILENTFSASARQASSSELFYEEVSSNETETEHVPLKVTSLNEKINALVNGQMLADDESLLDIIEELLKEDESTTTNAIENAALLASACSLNKDFPKCTNLNLQILLATKLPLTHIEYTGQFLGNAFQQHNPVGSPLLLAAYMYALLVPGQSFDYSLKAKTQQLLNDFDELFPDHMGLKPLFHKLCGIQSIAPDGFNETTLSLLGDEDENARFMKNLQEQARKLMTLPTVKVKITGLPEMVNRCFGPGSDLFDCMEIVSQNRHQDMELVKMVLSTYCAQEGELFRLDHDKIEDAIDKAWSAATAGKKTSKVTLGMLARQQVSKTFRDRLNISLTWIEWLSKKNEHAVPALNRLRGELQHLLAAAIQEEERREPGERSWILVRMMRYMLIHLEMCEAKKHDFRELLQTSLISLDEDGYPILDPAWNEVKYYEPWRLVLAHILAEKKDPDEVEVLIFRPDSSYFDNLNQWAVIGKLIRNHEEAYQISPQQEREARVFADEITKRFMDRMELDYVYGRIDELEKENISAATRKYKDIFYDQKDFGHWREFIGALDRSIKEFTSSHMERLKRRLKNAQASLGDGECATLLEKARVLLTEDRNFAVAEEYLNRFDIGERTFSEDLLYVKGEMDEFCLFISDAVYNRIYQVCMTDREKGMKRIGLNYLERNRPKDWTTRQFEDSTKLIGSWPLRKGTASPNQMKTLFSGLGFNIHDVRKITDNPDELFMLSTKALPGNQADYQHPIAAFGTEIRSTIPVIVLYGNYPAKQLVDTITQKNLGEIAIVLIDRPYDRKTRQQIAELYRNTTSQQNSFLLIDQVLFLFLAMHQETERLPALLKCALPYTTYQPFVHDSGPTSDEMFFGRTRELASIISASGACVVFGGRQLGKTALLLRAQSRVTRPDRKYWAVYSNIIDCKNEKAFVKRVIDDINQTAQLGLPECFGIRDLCDQIREKIDSGKVENLLLLLDECDHFLESISGDEYRQLQPLVDLRRSFPQKFKFVLAGLHNVCRAKNATNRNGVFGQLGTPLSIKPLSPTDAMQLLSRPLGYLGFRINTYSHLETILTYTNYYPGVLQFFGYTLVQTLNSQYARYYGVAKGNPPFVLQDEQLGAVMNSADLNQSIKEKFRLSLKLDPRYFMLARCLVMLYHLSHEGSSSSLLGFRVSEIKSMVDEYDIHSLSGQSIADYTNLLDEMEEMGILSKPAPDRYRLRRYSFLSIIGPDMDRLEVEIIQANEEVPV